jgi:hypothetical protein
MKPQNEDAPVRPEWADIVMGAKERAFDRLTPEQKAIAVADQRAWRLRVRKRREERKAKAVDHMRRIMRMLDGGHTAVEIGAAVGRNWRKVTECAAGHGVFISRSESAVRYGVSVSIGHRATLRALAAKHGVMNDVQVLETLIAAALDGDGVIARYVTRNPDGARAALVRAFTMGAPT